MKLRTVFSLCAALAASTAVQARTVEIDQATVAEINAGFTAGTLTSEKLVAASLARIAAYDRQGPRLHAMITVNAKALETARALDAERKAKGPRSPLHGIPVILKDNYDTADMATTGGSVALQGWVPAKDSFMVKKLRDAGAVVIGKANLSEFAYPPHKSSFGGQSLNPHDLARVPFGSSGGSGVAVAAGYGTFGLGTDTGGSIRGPAFASGIAALKPTYGLLSRSGIIPLALSLDTGGPMARTVSDVAAALGPMTGIDPTDPVTENSRGKAEADYTKYLTPGALKGARIGVARDFMGADPDVDWAVESAIDAMKKAGATVIDVRYPAWLLKAKDDIFFSVMNPEAHQQIGDYLAKTGPTYPKSIAQLLDRLYAFTSAEADGVSPNPQRWEMFVVGAKSGGMGDYRYKAAISHGMPMVRAIMEGILSADKLDAVVYPTMSARPPLIAAPNDPVGTLTPGARNLANLSGFPDLIVPAGFTGDGLPVTLSFFGPAFSEPKLFALGYSFEQATHAQRRPVNTPALTDASFDIP